MITCLHLNWNSVEMKLYTLPYLSSAGAPAAIHKNLLNAMIYICLAVSNVYLGILCIMKENVNKLRRLPPIILFKLHK